MRDDWLGSTRRAGAGVEDGGHGPTGSDGPGTDGPFVYELAPEDTPSRGVVMAVAALCDRPITSLEPLYEAVDPDALDRLVDHGSAGDGFVQVTFDYAGTTVAVDSTGRILLFE